MDKKDTANLAMRAQGPSREAELSTPTACAAALRAFFRIADAWSLSNEEAQQVLGCGRSQFFEWKAGTVKAGLDGVASIS